MSAPGTTKKREEACKVYLHDDRDVLRTLAVQGRVKEEEAVKERRKNGRIHDIFLLLGYN
jgi:hypothetical protein